METLRPQTFVDDAGEATARYLSFGAKALGAPAERIAKGMEYYGITRKVGEVMVDLFMLRARKIRSPRRRPIMLHVRNAF